MLNRLRIGISPSSCAGRIERSLKFIHEFLQLFRIDVADGKELETLRTPASDVKSLHRLELCPVTFGASYLRDEEIDHMRAASVDDRSDSLAVDVVEPAAEQREALRRLAQLRGRHSLLHLAMGTKLRRTPRTTLQMRLHIAGMPGIELAVEEGVKQDFGFGASHVASPSSAIHAARSMDRPRARRDI